MTRIDGISAGVVQTTLTELGLDLSAFPTEKHFVGWLRPSRRTGRRRGHSVAVFPLARKLAALVFRMLRYGQDHMYTGEKAYEVRSRHQRITGPGAADKSLRYKLVPREPVPL